MATFGQGFPFRYGCTPDWRHFFLDIYLPLQNVSHGKLRMIEKSLQIELTFMIQQWIKQEFHTSKEEKKMRVSCH